jgi:hypothetical protein
MKTNSNKPGPENYHDRHTGLTTEAFSRDTATFERWMDSFNGRSLVDYPGSERQKFFIS